MKTFLFAIFALFLQLPVVPTAAGPKASIEGVVLGLDNRPVAGVEVRAFWSPPPSAFAPGSVPQTVTEQDGKFVLRDLGAGGYRIRVTAGGYAWQEYGAIAGLRGADTGTVVTVTPGQSMQGITVRLARDGIISGRISFANGSPLLGMEVFALRRTFDAMGVASFKYEGQRAVTNDRGEYRITGLPAGPYFVRASSQYSGRIRIEQSAARSEGRAAPTEPSPGEYAPVFFPGVEESAKAAIVDVQAGAEARNVDFALPRRQLFRIRGRVVDPSSPGPLERVSIGTLPYRPDFLTGIGSSVLPYRPDGTFELTDIPPGVYWVRAQVPTSLPPELRALMSTPGANLSVLPMPPQGLAMVRIVDSDVRNVEITIVRDLTINGSVTLGDRTLSREELAGIKVELRPVTSSTSAGPPMGGMTKTPDGEFVYKNIPPGEFRMTMAGLPPDFYVKDARIGNVDVASQVFELIKPPSAPMNIVLARGNDVTGSVSDAGSRPVANQQVVLIPEGLRNRADLYKTATTDVNGRFTMRGVAPGNYKAFSWQSLEAFRYFDSEFLRPFEDRGAVVRVSDTAGAAVNLNLIP